ncbi:MFS transporter [Allonocardiopsis opalescens]|uniref:DHA2 family multidrug resistance protein-like MFS transporter n=1 Tax=Allonocardiopsis opalescens TaxID=1144618 RepID=A0A2T0Q528_9ACTN|nr:MFS transporter [Allonocardiopsis opalescens]PRX98896.1 DHA2 family multidrug resistance protein-like MFS transporter [Allonocardiopsis opalescens]
MHEQVTAPRRRAGRREWLGLAVLALPTLLLALDMSVLYLALPHLSADLGASATQQLWITDIYGFMIAGFLVTMGGIGDRIGRRRLLLIGAAAFGAASVLAAYAPTAETLILARAALGIAGATLMPSTLALISNMFRDPRQRGVAVAVWISCFMGGSAVGPVIGGVLLEAFWWGSVFLLGVPVMVLLLVSAPVLLPEYRDPAAQGRGPLAGVDLLSVGLSLGTMLPLVYGLKELAQHGLSPVPVAAVLLGAAVGAAFVARQRRLEEPLLDLTLFRNRSLSAALSINLVSGLVMGGVFFLVNLYMQLVAGLSPLEAGLWSVPQAIVMVAATQFAPRLARRIRPAYLMGGGLLVAAAGIGLLTQLAAPVGGIAANPAPPLLAIAAFVVVSVGMAPVVSLGTDMVLGAAPPEKAGSAASLSETGAELGIAMGVAVLGSAASAVYRGVLTGSLPEGLPAGAGAAAQESLAGAIAAAGELSAPVAVELVDAARAAFTSGMQVIALLGLVAFAVLAVLAIALLRHIEPVSGEAEESGPAEEPAADTAAPAAPPADDREPVAVG